jgi:hypothetical protein
VLFFLEHIGQKLVERAKVQLVTALKFEHFNGLAHGREVY